MSKFSLRYHALQEKKYHCNLILKLRVLQYITQKIKSFGTAIQLRLKEWSKNYFFLREVFTGQPAVGFFLYLQNIIKCY